MNAKDSAILVTGGCGYIGSHILLTLLENGQRPVVIDDLSTGSKKLLPEDVDFFSGSIGDISLLNEIFKKYKISAVMHLAGSNVVSESVSNPTKYHQNNTVNSFILLKFCIEHHISNFIFSSSASVYGENKNGIVTESDFLAPISPYGNSKLMIERMIQDFGKAYHFKYAILRYFNVAGADPKLRAGQISVNATHLIKVAAEVAVGARKNMKIYGTKYATPDGTCIRDYIHVTDLANIHLSVLNYLLAGHDSIILNCGYGHGFSVKEVIASFNKEKSSQIPIIESLPRQGDPAILVANNERISQVLKWKPKYDDIHIITSTALEWEKKLQLNLRNN